MIDTLEDRLATADLGAAVRLAHVAHSLVDVCQRHGMPRALADGWRRYIAGCMPREPDDGRRVDRPLPQKG